MMMIVFIVAMKSVHVRQYSSLASLQFTIFKELKILVFLTFSSKTWFTVTPLCLKVVEIVSEFLGPSLKQVRHGLRLGCWWLALVSSCRWEKILGCPKSCHVGCFSPELFVFLQRFLSFWMWAKKSLLAILTKRQTDFPEIDCLFFSAAVSAIINNKILLEDLYNHTYIGCGVHWTL